MAEINKVLEELQAIYGQHNSLADINAQIAKAQTTLNGLHNETKNEMKRLVDLQRERGEFEIETKRKADDLEKLRSEHSWLSAEVARLRAMVQQLPDLGNLKRTG